MKTVADFEAMVLAVSQAGEELHPSVLHELIRQTVVDFMRNTRIARDEYYFKPQCGVHDYLLDINKCHRLVGVEIVAGYDTDCRDTPIYDKSYWWPIEPQSSIQSRYMAVQRGYTIDMHTTPNTTIVLPSDADYKWIYISYSYTIGYDDCEIPDFIYDDWAQAIVAGSIAKIKQRAGAVDSYELQQYYSFIQQAKVRVSRGYKKGKIFMKAPSFIGRKR